MSRVTSATESTGVCRAKKTASSNIPPSPHPALVFDERPQPFGRVVPLCCDLVEVPLCSLEAFSIQVPDPLTPPARVAHQPHMPEGVKVARNRLTRHPGPFTETSNRQRPAGGQASQQAEPSRVAQRGEQRYRVGGGLQRGGAALTRQDRKSVE